MILSICFHKKFLISITYLYKLKRISLKKFNYKSKFNITYDVRIENNLNINTIKKCIKKLKKIK